MDLARGLRAAQCGGVASLVVPRDEPNHLPRQALQGRVIDERGQSITFSAISITEGDLATNVTVKGQVTLPKAAREAARIRPGDRVTVRVRPEGGVIIEAEAAVKSAEAYMDGLKDMSRRRPFRGFSTEEIMRVTRGED
jgi:antitoxin PrlF